MITKKAWSSGKKCLAEEATVVPDAKNKKSRWGVVYLGKTLQKLLEKYCAVQAIVYLLRASTQWSAAIGPEMVPSALSCRSVLLEVTCQRGEQDDGTTWRKSLV